MFDNNFLYVGQGDVGIASLKFEYENETSEMIVVKEHGKKTLLGYQEVIHFLSYMHLHSFYFKLKNSPTMFFYYTV